MVVSPKSSFRVQGEPVVPHGVPAYDIELLGKFRSGVRRCPRTSNDARVLYEDWHNQRPRPSVWIAKTSDIQKSSSARKTQSE